MKYLELLKDPRWQKKRLEILQRDSFTCRRCGASDKTLHVHHRYYIRGCSPWENPDNSLLTLCVDCHENEPTLQNAAQTALWEAVYVINGYSTDEIEILSGLLTGMPFDDVLALLVKWGRKDANG